MIKPLNLACLPFVLALGVAPVPAQPAPAPQAESSTEPAPQASDGAPQKAASASAEAAQKGASATRRNESPFEYRSSEEISEDLSVSFPVDI